MSTKYEDISNFIASNGCKLDVNEIDFEYCYKNVRSKLKFICKCGEGFITRWSEFKYGKKRHCDKCGNKQKNKINYKEIAQFINDYTGNGCFLLTKENEYKNTLKNLEIRCKCGEVFNTSFSKFKHINKRQCNSCGNDNRRKSHDNFIKEVKKLYGNEYEVLGKYTNNYTCIKTKHISDTCNNYIFNMEPRRLIRGQACPECARIKNSNNKILSEKEIKDKFFKLVGDEYEIVGQYTKYIDKLLIRHNSKKCNFYEWEVSPHQFINAKSRCPVCNEYKGEKLIRNFLINNEIEFIPQYKFNDCIYKRKLSFDFAIFNKDGSLELLIEYDGIQHFEPVT